MVHDQIVAAFLLDTKSFFVVFFLFSWQHLADEFLGTFIYILKNIQKNNKNLYKKWIY